MLNNTVAIENYEAFNIIYISTLDGVEESENFYL